MSIFIGIIVKEVITNTRKFDQTLKEIIHFLKTHSDDIKLIISESLITVKPLFGGFEFNLPINSQYFCTSYYRITFDQEISEDIRKFAEIAWECLCILKENFPSKIELFHQKLDTCLSLEEVSFNLEMLRRQLNCLTLKLKQREVLKKDELSDLFYVLQQSLKEKNFKGAQICLGILDSQQCPPCLLLNLNEGYLQILEKVATDSFADYFQSQQQQIDDQQSFNEGFDNEISYREYYSVKNYASQLINKIQKFKKINNTGGLMGSSSDIKKSQQKLEKEDIQQLSNLKLMSNNKIKRDEGINSDYKQSIQKQYQMPLQMKLTGGEQQFLNPSLVQHNVSTNLISRLKLKKFENTSNFEEPQYFQSLLFQLKETKDIERITFILDNIIHKNEQHLEDLQHYNLYKIIEQIIDKYCQGDLGIDQSELTQYCVFHNRLLEYAIKSYISKDDLILQHFQKKQVSVKLIQIVEEGVLNVIQNIVNLDQKEQSEQELFFKISKNLFEIFLDLNLEIQLIKESIENIQNICKNYLGLSDNQPEQELLVFSQDLKLFYTQLSDINSQIKYKNYTLNCNSVIKNSSSNQKLNILQ